MKQGLLFVSRNRPDAALIERMLGPVGVEVRHALSLRDAVEVLRRERVAVVLTEALLADGNWTDMLDLVQQLPEPPVVLVTDRLADHRLWAEVLNLGAYDLLAQPFDIGEVQRIVGSACLRAAHRKPVVSEVVRTARVAAHGAF